MKTPHPQNGFTLIEALVSTVVFGLGMLGMALYSGNGLKATANNNARASALQVVSQAMDPLVNLSAASLGTELGRFPKTIKSDNDRDSYSINLVTMQDGTGTTITNVNGATLMPVTVVVSVPYTSFDGSTVTLRPSFTFY